MRNQFAVSEANANFVKGFDLFVCTASFEERSTVLPLALDPEIAETTILFWDPALTGEDGSINAGRIKEHFDARLEEVTFDIRNPLSVADSMVRTLIRGPRAKRRILIDVTTFTHEDLLILLRVLQIGTTPDDEITGIYVGASEYAVGMPPERKWLTQGVAEIRSVLGYSGQSQPAQSQHLVVLAGFEVDRAENLIQAYEPAALSVGYGSKIASISDSHHQLNRKYYDRIIANHANARCFEFACDDIGATAAQVQRQVAEFPEFNTVIAPLNTKISTIGVGIAALKDESIQICYAVPLEYNTKAYSSASSRVYSFSIILPSDSISA